MQVRRSQKVDMTSRLVCMSSHRKKKLFWGTEKKQGKKDAGGAKKVATQFPQVLPEKQLATFFSLWRKKKDTLTSTQRPESESITRKRLLQTKRVLFNLSCEAGA